MTSGTLAHRISMCLISFNDITGDRAMTRTSAQALALARPVIQGLTLLNAFYALCIAALLIFSFFIEGWPQRPLGFDLVNAHPQVGNGLRAIIVIGLAGA